MSVDNFQNLNQIDREYVETSLKQMTRVLTDRKFASRLPKILRHLEKVINKRAGIIKIKIITAKKLNTDSKNNLIQKLLNHYSAKEVLLDEVIDEKLIGGVRVEVGDEVLDLTLKNKLNQLKDHLTKNDHE